MCYVLKMSLANWQKWHPRGFRSGPTVKQGKEEFHACQSFNPGLLPTHRLVLERMIVHLLPSGPAKNLATPSKDEAAFTVGRS